MNKTQFEKNLSVLPCKSLKELVVSIRDEIVKDSGMRMSLKDAKEIGIREGIIPAPPSRKSATTADTDPDQVVMGIPYPTVNHALGRQSDEPIES